MAAVCVPVASWLGAAWRGNWANDDGDWAEALGQCDGVQCMTCRSERRHGDRSECWERESKSSTNREYLEGYIQRPFVLRHSKGKDITGKHGRGRRGQVNLVTVEANYPVLFCHDHLQILSPGPLRLWQQLPLRAPS